MKNTLCELLDQATILGHRKTNKEIAEYLESCGVIVCRQDELPAADVKRVKAGEWLEDEYAYFRCSECGYEQDHPETVTPYCPGCGAHMEDE